MLTPRLVGKDLYLSIKYLYNVQKIRPHKFGALVNVLFIAVRWQG